MKTKETGPLRNPATPPVLLPDEVELQEPSPQDKAMAAEIADRINVAMNWWLPTREELPELLKGGELMDEHAAWSVEKHLSRLEAENAELKRLVADLVFYFCEKPHPVTMGVRLPVLMETATKRGVYEAAKILTTSAEP